MPTSAMADVDYALGLAPGLVPRQVSVILLEGDIGYAAGGTYSGPDGLVTNPSYSYAAKIEAGDYVKMNVLSSCTSLATEGAIAVEIADASGDFIIGQMVEVSPTFVEPPTAAVAGTVSDTGDIGPLLANGYYRTGTMALFAMTILEGIVGSATDIIPGDSVAPSAGATDFGFVYVAPGLSTADGGQYDTDATAMDLQQQAYWIAGNAAQEIGDTIAVIVGLSPCLMVA